MSAVRSLRLCCDLHATEKKKTTQHLFEVVLGEVTKGAWLGREGDTHWGWSEALLSSFGVNPLVHGISQE